MEQVVQKQRRFPLRSFFMIEEMFLAVFQLIFRTFKFGFFLFFLSQKGKRKREAVPIVEEGKISI